MAAIVWDPSKMSTGVPGVDAQHREWIRRYNQFDDAIHQGKGIEAVQNTLNFFIDYAETHFTFEEAVMDERHCPAAKANKAAHEHMLHTLDGFKSCAEKHGYSMIEMLGLKFQMEEWVINHILTIDIQLRNEKAETEQKVGAEYKAKEEAFTKPITAAESRFKVPSFGAIISRISRWISRKFE
jgi:hemerythrin